MVLREIERVVCPNPWADYANKRGKIQREREHSEGERHRKIDMIPLDYLSVLFVHFKYSSQAQLPAKRPKHQAPCEKHRMSPT